MIESAKGTGLLQSFLAKKLRAHITWLTPDAEDTILVGVARGDATVTEIKAALETEQVERDMQDQANVRVVLHETVHLMHADVNSRIDPIDMEISLGGGKGIPFEDGDGWQWFAYNIDNADLVAGGEVVGYAVMYGVWL